MIKVQHSIFALPWALVAAFYAAGGVPAWEQMGWILLAMVSARSAAMAFNRIVDAKLDAENPRTKERAIPAGKLTVGFTTVFTLVMAGLLAFSAWKLNPLCLKLAPVALVVTMGYSYTKRFTPLCHLALGVSLSLAPLGAWIAIRPDDPLNLFPLLLAGAVAFWIAGADVLYACEDAEFDKKKGLHSIPASLGIPRALVIARLFHALSVCGLFGAGVAADLGLYWYGAMVVIGALLIYEHAIVSPNDLRRVNQAFFKVNPVVSGVFLAGGMMELFLSK